MDCEMADWFDSSYKNLEFDRKKKKTCSFFISVLLNRDFHIIKLNFSMNAAFHKPSESFRPNK
jgi:hypothetical protein